MKKVPKIGARTIKTALAVFCTIVLLKVFNRESSFFACIAAILCMQPTVHGSFKAGKQRLIGTFVGAMLGLIFASITSLIPFSSTIIYAIIVSTGIIALIYTCISLSINECVNIACVTYLAILLNVGTSEWLPYSLNRIIETFVGVIIGIFINRFILVPKKEKK